MRVFTTIQPKEATHIPEPPIARFLFADTRMAWFWLLVRLYVGYQWLTAGLDKLTGMPPSYSWWCCPTPRSLPTWSPSVRCSLGSVCSWGC